MPYYRSVGAVPRKRHRTSECFEELVGQEGFAGASSLLYHRHSPSGLVSIASEGPRAALVANQPLAPRLLHPPKLACGPDPVSGRVDLAGNAHVQLAWWSGGEGSSPLYRDASGDELAYVQSGTARVESALGVLDLGPGDYVVLPAGIVHRWLTYGPTEVLFVEAIGGHVGVPQRYLTETGQLREGAPFSERDIRSPSSPLLVDGEDTDVLVRTRAGLTRHTLAHHPFDVVGWDGCIYPWAFQILDFEPIVGRFHQPPTVHQTFEGPRFTVCSFVPRLFDTDPDAVKVPYHHSNVDSDEVLLYSRGEFMSRAGAGIGPGSMTIHPSGFVHGPQRGSRDANPNAARTEEVAVMIDTFDPLLLSTAGLDAEDTSYWRSWSP